MINRGIATRTLALGWLLFTAVGCSVAADRASTPSDSRIAVTFVQPERFTDAKDGEFEPWRGPQFDRVRSCATSIRPGSRWSSG